MGPLAAGLIWRFEGVERPFDLRQPRTRVRRQGISRTGVCHGPRPVVPSAQNVRSTWYGRRSSNPDRASADRDAEGSPGQTGPLRDL